MHTTTSTAVNDRRRSVKRAANMPTKAMKAISVTRPATLTLPLAENPREWASTRATGYSGPYWARGTRP